MGCCVAKDAAVNGTDLDAPLPPTPTNSQGMAGAALDTTEVYRRRQMTADDRIREARRRLEPLDGGGSAAASMPECAGLGEPNDEVGSTPQNPLMHQRSANSRNKIIHAEAEIFGSVRNTKPVPADDPHWRLKSSTAGLSGSRRIGSSQTNRSPGDALAAISHQIEESLTQEDGRWSHLRAVETHLDSIGQILPAAGVAERSDDNLWGMLVEQQQHELSGSNQNNNNRIEFMLSPCDAEPRR